ncbi:EutN/CcmL family microcompartment protein [Listeria seeligeri]|uniref:EutN/CcmL family microcompartment protein n=1 Tax=Listeria seeligeri TaxID=1640 RepID=UPI0022EBBC91|nr:EutN/CcmL family microcompartment protein [Listeria seeligeri]
MFMAKITGSVVSTKKEGSLVGKKLMIVQPVDANGENVRSEEVACDSVGAGIGEYVLVARGNAARSVFMEPNSAIDSAIIAIVDSFDK